MIQARDFEAPVSDGSPRARIHSIDAVRGLVMVLMALDHTRDFFGDIRLTPEDLEITTPALFLTRWVTHLCAPTFVFLAGTSAYLYGRKHGPIALPFFLRTRGLWLIVLEFTVIYFGWMLTFGVGVWFVQVISAIAISMIVLSMLVRLPVWAVGAVGLSIVAFHNVLDPITPQRFGWASGFWRLLHEGGAIPLPLDQILLIAYPVLAWVGVMATGYALGPVFALDQPKRRQTLFVIGGISCALFVALRWSNAYGDARLWSPQSSLALSVISFLNCTKYPPSLAFLLMTLGPALILLTTFDRAPNRVGRFLKTFGRVPLFFYILHLYVIHIASGLYYKLTHGEFFSSMQTMFRSVFADAQFPAWYGHGLRTVYVAWVLLIALLFPLCLGYSRLKRGNSLLRYL